MWCTTRPITAARSRRCSASSARRPCRRTTSCSWTARESAERKSPASPRPAGRRGEETLDRGLEALEGNRLDEVIREAGLAAAAHVLLHPVARQRDAGKAVALAQPPHHVETVAVGQSQVRDDAIEALGLSRGQGFL